MILTKFKIFIATPVLSIGKKENSKCFNNNAPDGSTLIVEDPISSGNNVGR